MAEEPIHQQPLGTLLDAMGWLGWIIDDAEHPPAVDPLRKRNSRCLLRDSLALDGKYVHFDPAWSARIERVLEQGVELAASWPRPWSASVERWLGRRFFMAHAVNLHARTEFATVVSSQLGRGGFKLPRWPSLLDSALRHIYQQGHSLLLAPGTTVAEAAQEFAFTAGLRSVSLILPQGEPSLAAWLLQSIERIQGSESEGCSRDEISLSPPMPIAPADEQTHELAPSSLAALPLADRAAIALADSVYAMSVRPKGNIQQLMQQRLTDPNFPAGTVYLNLSKMLDFAGGQSNTHDRLTSWLDQGAVGWYVPPTADATAILSRCRVEPADPLATQQLCSAIPSSWTRVAAAEWPFLSHCTRCNSGPLPEESPSRYRQRLWTDGQVAINHPMLTLHQICQERRLLGTAQLTRTHQRLVSFSAVPLPQLLQRREFKPHLGRWDWEPYGLILDRLELQKVGAQPVLYGSEEEYNALHPERKAFFQPWGKTDGRTASRWSAEQEWRVLGDVDLAELPRESIRLFVHTRDEALHLSRRFPWPVFWTA